MGKNLKLKARLDFVQRLAKSPPIDALQELIWNGFDEDATHVTVSIEKNELEVVEKIIVQDNGKSLHYDKAQDAFENLGNSDKATRRLVSGDKLHGSKGEGRHKAFSLGSHVVWQFTYKAKDNSIRRYSIQGKSNSESPFYLTDEEPAPEGSQVGCIVTIVQPTKTLHSMLQEETKLRLTTHFCQFLVRHPTFELNWCGQKLTPSDVIRHKKVLKDESYSWKGTDYSVQIEVVEWKSSKDKEILLCSTAGVPLKTIAAKDLCAIQNYSIFATSKVFDDMDEENSLSSIENTADSAVVERIRKKARSHFRQQYKRDATKALQLLKREGSYPYLAPATTLVEKYEQKVFDACTLSILRNMPSFQEKMDVDARKLLLRMVKESLSQNPTAVGKIIREVCKLPTDDANRFADLLDNVPLNKVVQTSALISDRLCFLDLFDSIVHLNPFAKQIKERTQLQKVLSPNTWIFGEEYALGGDDNNLRKILEKHVRILGRDHIHSSVDDKTLRQLIHDFNSKRAGTNLSLDRIPDIMLWKKFLNRQPDEYEFLIVEIKRPGVHIGRDECAQIEDYAKAVTTTPFADMKKTNWTFVIISDDLDDTTKLRLQGSGSDPNILLKIADKRFVIKVFTWSEIIRGARARHEFLKKSLDFTISEDKTIAIAEKRFANILPKRLNKRPN